MNLRVLNSSGVSETGSAPRVTSTFEKLTVTKGGGADYTDEEKTTIAKGTVRNEFRKRTGMSFQEFFANVKADSAAASA